MRLSPLALSLAGLLAGCGPIGFSVPVCQTLDAQQVPGAPISVYGNVERVHTLDLREDLAKVGDAISEVQLTSLTLIAREGIADFGWIDEAALFLTAPDGTRSEVARYQKDPAAAPPASLKLAIDSVDVLPQLAAGPVEVVLDFTGTLPTEDWTVDVKTCASAKAVLVE